MLAASVGACAGSARKGDDVPGRKRRRKQRSRLLPLLVLLSLLGGAGAWNFRLNVEAEQAVPRPYRVYSDADLLALEGAYRSELDALTAQQGSDPGRVRARDRGFGAAQVAEFERVHRASRAARNAGYARAEREIELGKIEEERRLRAEMGSDLKRFLHRVFGFS